MASDSGIGLPGSGAGDSTFAGSIPDTYERLMVPMIFAAPAKLLADAVADRVPADVLETAAGTGVLTRAMRERLPGTSITATDLNEPMLLEAQSSSGLTDVHWQQADALELPFDDASFDVVACQFGVMFFPDKVAGFAEAHRVLRPDGAFIFNSWDRVETNQVTHVINEALVAASSTEPLVFMRRTPHGYFDEATIRGHLEAAGFTRIEMSLLVDASRTTATEAAIAFTQGTPLRGEIQRHPTIDPEAALRIATEALLAHFGHGPIAPPITWWQVVAS